MRGVTFGILLKVSLLDEMLNLLLVLVVVLCVVYFNLMKLTPSSKTWSHNIRFWRWMCMDIMLVENLLTDMLMESVQECEVLHILSILLERCYVPYGWFVVVFLRVLSAFGTRNTFFHVTSLLLKVTFLDLYIVFRYCDHLC